MSATTAIADAGASTSAPDLVKQDEDLAHWSAVAAKMAAAEHRRVLFDFLRTAAVVFAVPIAASGWIAREVWPEVKQEIEFIPTMSDGTIASAHRWEHLPKDVQEDVAVNSAWNYVRHREGYSSAGSEYASRIIWAMSTDKLWQEWWRDNNPRNPDSPFQKWGENKRVEIGFDSHYPLCDVMGCKEGEPPVGYQFRFWRTEVADGVRQPPVAYVAQMRFKRGVSGLHPAQLYTFNAPALQITDYVKGTPAGAQPGGNRR
jgi:hypothetical protein